jgi:hypothetical protein
MDIKIASYRSIEFMAAYAGFRMAFNRSVEIIAAYTRFRMACNRVPRPWRPPTGLLRSKRP